MSFARNAVVLLSVRDSCAYGTALRDPCHNIHPRAAAQPADRRGGREKGSPLLFNYFTTLALRCAVTMVIPQIKVCGFYSPSPRLSHSHALLIDSLESPAAVT